MEGVSVAALVRAVSEYGVLGLGWVAWILTMYYYRKEQERYQALVIHIIQYFTKVNLGGTEAGFDPTAIEPNHRKTFGKLFKGP